MPGYGFLVDVCVGESSCLERTLSVMDWESTCKKMMSGRSGYHAGCLG